MPALPFLNSPAAKLERKRPPSQSRLDREPPGDRTHEEIPLPPSALTVSGHRSSPEWADCPLPRWDRPFSDKDRPRKILYLSTKVFVDNYELLRIASLAMKQNQGKLPKPTEAELELLRVLWDKGSATVRELHEAVGEDRPWGYT